MLVNNFKCCSDEVKIDLFKAYCSNLYCAHLWSSYRNSKYNRIRVAYNDSYRALMNFKRGESISAEYVTRNVNSFEVLVRKAVYSFLSRALLSTNSLVSTIIISVYFIYASPLFEKWKKCLYNNLG